MLSAVGRPGEKPAASRDAELLAELDSVVFERDFLAPTREKLLQAWTSAQRDRVGDVDSFRAIESQIYDEQLRDALGAASFPDSATRPGDDDEPETALLNVGELESFLVAAPPPPAAELGANLDISLPSLPSGNSPPRKLSVGRNGPSESPLDDLVRQFALAGVSGHVGADSGIGGFGSVREAAAPYDDAAVSHDDGADSDNGEVAPDSATLSKPVVHSPTMSDACPRGPAEPAQPSRLVASLFPGIASRAAPLDVAPEAKPEATPEARPEKPQDAKGIRPTTAKPNPESQKPAEKANARIQALETALKRAGAQAQKSAQDARTWQQQEREKLLAWRERETRALRRERAQWERSRRAADVLPTKRERVETERLAEELAAAKAELQRREARWALERDRLRQRCDQAAQQNRELQEEVRALEQDRGQWLAKAAKASADAADAQQRRRAAAERVDAGSQTTAGATGGTGSYRPVGALEFDAGARMRLVFFSNGDFGAHAASAPAPDARPLLYYHASSGAVERWDADLHATVFSFAGQVEVHLGSGETHVAFADGTWHAKRPPPPPPAGDAAAALLSGREPPRQWDEEVILGSDGSGSVLRCTLVDPARHIVRRERVCFEGEAGVPAWVLAARSRLSGVISAAV